jgi:hypothetical protein
MQSEKVSMNVLWTDTGFRKSQIQGLFKAVYQQIQGLNTEEGVRNQQNLTLIVQNVTL